MLRGKAGGHTPQRIVWSAARPAAALMHPGCGPAVPKKPETLAQLGEQVEAGVLGHPHQGLMPMPELVILANANVEGRAPGEL
jgi:hypothetical protein